MKIKVIDLLNKIANNEEIKRVLFKNQVYEYDEDGKDYYNEKEGWLFDGYSLITILNDEVEILETTITMNKKIEKIDIDITEEAQFGINAKLIYKINELIDYINKE